MKLVTFSYQGVSRVGAVVGNAVVDSLGRADIPQTMLEFLAAGQTALQALQELIDSQRQRLALSEVKLMAPVPRPGKFLGVGLNYADHIAETALEKPEYPTFFTKQSTCVIAQGEAIHVPKVSEKLDYEVELAFVIGKRCRHVLLDDAHKVIAGYTLVNDVSVRDWQFRSPTWTLGKSFDTHGPMGPWIVTADEISDPHNLNLKTWIDDELRQSSNTQHMIFNCYEMIAYLSQAMTLEPGDVIATGTPSGVGVKMKPRGYMQAGQTVKIEIEHIGSLVNPVIDEPDNFVLSL
ncbi:fumarylacetoacetate hydrolase family protein [methanotrophic endosymbiont of Bathymodiolus puteoserpentis (Logatchev)]|jgi:2-keto-4-pentenoate hydratase/2-oxohepta-3-ene-1,7-dioic acid hydratase in catechol pathway|uniref:fumarylacetoacetate hydrolase family protein n=1 Tax=methanotrophic endosymbiont of Bathymodiolus puteoserpentis (Logatchev) TaxID=343235 RepID=UPI0013CB887B|nr:fumarylacetoacetate hydrolase family protein [methanotrophic endosymbiont of Bathymodiolus puteoserpentis (Logatchev)]SHE21787.1 Fumarylacetoacetate hydrolase family protein [methanotrophic endosymbiont of Bathymodiolus puteoserpentis (Logatchev)]